ncbi:NAD(P)-dependent oxidoreductase [Actinoplanes sp. HUAS TT8]|uniref:NAD(P)-dependent oxidoreductase n=1 Tax=Actinoplanes sp. HUAS TT8 TaxID=3447453 RepID=UPI003F51DAD1
MSSIVIFGAGGRAGRAIRTEALSRGHEVVAVLRDPQRHPDIDNAVRGDITDPDSVAAIVAGHDAAVNAVSPASGPEDLAKLALDPDFFVKAVDALVASKVDRIVAIGLVSNLDGADELPEQFRAFAQAHAAGVQRLKASDADWVMLTPPMQLSVEAARLGRYETGGEAFVDGHLSYADLAVAVVDEIEKPTLHGRRATVFNVD